MHWRSGLPVLAGVLAGLALLVPRHALAQQNAAGKQVSIKTADGVDLAGTFYAGTKSAPTVLFLHSLGKGEDSHKGGWDSLAAALNKKGYSVLSFDFRGHGGSTTIDNPQKFWATPDNRTHVRPNRAAPGAISVEDYDSRYYPFLVNDIAAAKSYLDLQNDAGLCNSSALVLIGADTGATLGAVWLNSEFYRYKVLPADLQRPYIHLDEEPEGTANAAAIFLSISPTLGKTPVSLTNILKVPGQVQAIPMVFAYGDEDKKGKAEAKRLEKYLKTNRLKNQKFTGGFAVANAGKATGRDLLRTGLNTEAAIVDYIGHVLEKAPQWINRDFQKSTYVWATPLPLGRIPPTAVQAKGPQELVIRWSNYARFMPRY